MKFVTLALAILLAVGCRAASLQADAPAGLPTYMEHIRAGMRVYLDQMKAFVDNVAEEAKKDAEIADIGEKIKTKTQEFYDSLIAFQTEQAPKTDNYVAVVDEATRDMRNAIHADMEALQTQLEPMRAELRQVVEKHIAEYKAVLDEFKLSHLAEFQTQMEDWKTKVAPVMQDLRAKFDANVEETKGKLMPILEAIRTKMHERLEKVKEDATPYVHELKEQMKQAYEQGQSGNAAQKLTPHFNSLQKSVTDLMNEVKGMVGL